MSGCSGPVDQTARPSADQTARPSADQTALPSAEPTASGPAEQTAMPSDADVTAARQKIESADLGSPKTIDELEGVRFTAAGEQAARDVLASASGRDALWAATWVYASSATEPAPLRPLLENGDASIRTMAAAALVALGDRSGFGALEASLSDADQLRGSHPPISVGGFTLDTLSRYVHAADAPEPPQSGQELANVQARWADWLQRHGNDLQFDAPSGTWNAP